jgi:hypothetical protein
MRFRLLVAFASALAVGAAALLGAQWSSEALPSNPTDYYTQLALAGTGVSPLADRAEPGKLETGPPPRLVVDEEEHKFGVMDVGQKGRHSFVVRNVGAGELRLAAGETSCKCTLVDLPDGVVPPGGETRIDLEWETRKPDDVFRHGAYIHTNDPERPEFSLRISGRVRELVAVEPASLVFSSVGPGERPEAMLTISAETWPDLEVVDIESSLPVLSGEVLPKTTEGAGSEEPETRQDVRVALEPGLPVGSFLGQLRIRVRPRSQPDVAPITKFVNVEGAIVPAIALYGRGYSIVAGLRLGILPAGQGIKRTLHLVLQGDHRDLIIREVRARPDSISVHVRRDAGGSGKKTHYRLEVEISADAPPVDCLGVNRGEIVIVTDHPHQPEIRVPVAFAIVSAQ